MNLSNSRYATQGSTTPAIFMEGRPVLAEIYGTPLAITASGNSHPVANTPVPLTDPMLENPSADTGALMCVLSIALITSCPIDPPIKSSNSREGAYDPASFTTNPLKTTLLIVEPFSRIKAATWKLLLR